MKAKIQNVACCKFWGLKVVFVYNFNSGVYQAIKKGGHLENRSQYNVKVESDVKTQKQQNRKWGAIEINTKKIMTYDLFC